MESVHEILVPICL